MTEPATYVELHCHSYFSLLNGASSPEALTAQAAALGYQSLALTDHNGLYGAIRFWHAAREQNLQAIIGAEVHLQSGEHLTLLAQNQQGYANLCRFISAGQLAGQKAHPQLALEELLGQNQGLICLSGCRQGAITSAILARDCTKVQRAAALLKDAFGPQRFWIELQRHYLPADARLAAVKIKLARRLGLGLVATNNVHYAQRSERDLHDVLTCIRHHTTLPQALAGGLLPANSEQFLKSSEEMTYLFRDLPEAITNSQLIAEQCNVSLDFSKQRLPLFPTPEGHTAKTYLRELCKQGLEKKLSPITPQARKQLAYELSVIEGLGLSGYFLVVWDIVRFAREQGIRCQGRGSAANSLVAYLLDITPVDPLHHNLLFERFLSEESHSMPDIDVDFASDRREEVIQYIYDRYGKEHVGMVCNIVTYRARSALREVAKALAFPPEAIDQAAKALDTRKAAEAAQITQAATGQEPGEANVVRDSPHSPHKSQTGQMPPSIDASLPWQTLSELLSKMDGIPRHLSIHVGGMLITAAPLVEVVPLERATMPDRVVVQWNKDSVEDAGLIKIDLLSLRTLAVVEEALHHIEEQRGLCLNPDDWPLDDPAVFDLLQRADTVGCFQVESRAQAQMLPKLLPERFEDIVVGVALIRPGPIQGGMVHPYLRRRRGLEPVEYDHPALEPALAETLGVIVFQEQVIRVAMATAGFSPAEGDRLRKTMNRNRPEEMTNLRHRFVAGAQAKGIETAAAVEIWQQLEGFAGFGFCKSHAAAFALIAYQTLYLKAHFPTEFFCGLFNQQPMGFYPPEVLAGDARRRGIPILHPDINHSLETCTLEKQSAHDALGIRLGLSYVHGLGESAQERIVDRRGPNPFRTLPDFCRRTHLPRKLVENLIRAGAMDSLAGKESRTRRQLLWELGGLVYQEGELDIEVPVMPAALPVLNQAERLSWEYELMGMAPGEQVMDLYREKLRAGGVLSSSQLADRQNGQRVSVAGWAVVRQRPPTAKGVLFITLEDEEGLMNLIVRPHVYDRYRSILRNSPLLWVEGKLQREGQAHSILVYQAAPLGRPG